MKTLSIINFESCNGVVGFVNAFLLAQNYPILSIIISSISILSSGVIAGGSIIPFVAVALVVSGFIVGEDVIVIAFIVAIASIVIAFLVAVAIVFEDLKNGEEE